jgi:hypothetical protein
VPTTAKHDQQRHSCIFLILILIMTASKHEETLPHCVCLLHLLTHHYDTPHNGDEMRAGIQGTLTFFELYLITID